MSLSLAQRVVNHVKAEYRTNKNLARDMRIYAMVMGYELADPTDLCTVYDATWRDSADREVYGDEGEELSLCKKREDLESVLMHEWDLNPFYRMEKEFRRAQKFLRKVAMEGG